MNRQADSIPAASLPLTRRFLRPIERFLGVEAAGGVILLSAAAVALLWANSPFSPSYEALWNAPLTFGFGTLISEHSLRFWVNEGLMTIFFLVVGLEIRREMHDGALSEAAIATLPVVAAAAGVIVPAIIYIALNTAPLARRGWAVPTATDIAFAVGVLSLAGKGMPPALRMLLLTLAIVDDVAAILIIAFVYSSGVALEGTLIACCGVLAVLGLQRLGARRAFAYVFPGAIVWFGMLRAGIHPTLAGVVLGLLTPVKTALGHEAPVAASTRALDEIGERLSLKSHDPRELVAPVRRLSRAHREILPPVTRVESALHPWVAYLIMPLFALANAGVSYRGLGGEAGVMSNAGHSVTVGAGIVAGLVLGKPVGIILASFAAVRLRLCILPEGVRWPHIVLLGCLGGVGFTMALFIANLAFTDPALLAMSKLAVLAASGLAATVALITARLIR